MEAKIGKFFESVGDFFSGGDQIPWCDSDIVVVSLCSFDKFRLNPIPNNSNYIHGPTENFLII